MIFSQGIFAFLSVLTLSTQAELTKRTLEDGMGDSTAAGAHLSFGYNGKLYFSFSYEKRLIFFLLKQNLTLGLNGPLYWSKFSPQCGGSIQSPINSKLI
jgi:hypothetical protein